MLAEIESSTPAENLSVGGAKRCSLRLPCAGKLPDSIATLMVFGGGVLLLPDGDE